jgi:hypothetical protein|tara:strand:- start:144 stop:491 length:348 start_codon:yes stop_codon:yes gene_type:complete
MKRLLLALLLALPLSGSARMFPTEFPIKAICWDDITEVLQYHQEVLGEYPIGKGWINSKDGPSFGAVMYNPTKPSWTFLTFHKKEGQDAVIICAITGGSMWEIINPGDELEKLQL